MKRDAIWHLIVACEHFGLDPRSVLRTEVKLVRWPWNRHYVRADRL